MKGHEYPGVTPSRVGGWRVGVPFALVLLAGCSQAIDHERPPLPVRTAFPAELAPGGTARPAPETPWREFFADPRLQALIARALDTNRDLQLATARIDEARAQFRIARADLLPTVDLAASARYGDGSNSGGGAVIVDLVTPPGSGTGGGGSASTTGGGNRFRVDVEVSAFELDFWGRVRSLSAAARARFLETVEAQLAFRISLIGDVADAYLQGLELDERLRLAEATIVSRRTSLRLAERLFQEGEGSRLEIAQEAGLLAQAEDERALIREQRARAANLLELLVGAPLDASLPAARPLTGQGLLADIPAGLSSDLLVARPDVRAAEQALRAAGADVGATRAAFFPRIALTGSLGFASEDLDGLFSSGPVWSFIPNLLQPLFDFGRTRAAVDLAQARRVVEIAAYERTVQIAFREVADALATRRFVADRIAAQERFVATQRERLRLAELRFGAGFSPALDVLDARRELLAAEQTLVQTRRARLANAVTLYVALGGGLV